MLCLTIVFNCSQPISCAPNRMKEEEQARKKAEEKARKEAIFQQYLQKKLDQDEEKSPPSVAITRRERANQSQPRPKSMFAKARPLPDHDSVASGGMATHSSQEDLSSQASPPGSTGRGVRPVRCGWGGVGVGMGSGGGTWWLVKMSSVCLICMLVECWEEW